MPQRPDDARRNQRAVHGELEPSAAACIAPRELIGEHGHRDAIAGRRRAQQRRPLTVEPHDGRPARPRAGRARPDPAGDGHERLIRSAS